MQKIRTFIAMDIPVSQKVTEIINELKKIQIDAKIVEIENMHLTLKFLGDTDEKLIDEIEKIIKDAILNMQPFEIILKNLGVFPNEKYMKVAWIGVENAEPLKKIAETSFKIKDLSQISRIDSISPPSVFIGSKLKYPLVNVGILSPLERDDPRAWPKKA